MKRWRHIGNRDRNEREIVQALEAIGCQVWRISSDKPACPDLLLLYRGRWSVGEVKSSTGRLSTRQRALQQHVRLIRTVRDAFEVIGAQLTL